jgi:hypothetical protein
MARLRLYTYRIKTLLLHALYIIGPEPEPLKASANCFSASVLQWPTALSPKEGDRSVLRVYAFDPHSEVDSE